ncbi:MAG TPA: HGGxSTG domain-containing protein [Cellvibrionaceae bacterium]|nr:HGGxSTG domain-containing protein [Cellvibrionaceae bacterium]HMW71324.1 HGGxSTG domain-containing protein [Cellvibrionaceae bacterium]
MNYSTPEKRKLYRWYYTTCTKMRARHDAECTARFNLWLNSDRSERPPRDTPPPIMPPYPQEIIGMACGARTRKGTPCKRTDLYLSGRCKFHGGMSTGPRTAEGKAKVALNGRVTCKPREALTKVKVVEGR